MKQKVKSVKSISPKEIEEILYHFSKSMHGMDSEDQLLWDMAKNCISILGFEDAVIYLVDENNQVLVQKAALGPKNPTGTEILNALQIPIGEGITGKVAQTGLPILISDTRNYPEYIQDDEFRLSELAVPILLDGKVIGVIDSENSEADYFSKQHLRILMAVSSIYSSHMARIRAEKKAKEEQKERWKIQQKATRLQIEAISAQLSPHFVFNSLNAIQHYILLEDKRSSLRFLSIFGKLLRYFLAQLHEESVTVSDEVQMLDWYLQLQELRYGDKLKYSIQAVRLEEFPQAKIPSIIVQSLIENLLEEQIHLSDGNIGIQISFELSFELVELNVLINKRIENEEFVQNSAYLKSLTPWQDYIRLINDIRPYRIESKIGPAKCPDGNENCKSVSIIFPNLFSS
ncbi:MAG: histidine kinase [Algoriphagus aquaeductus]|uniref:histidine kinase n=1 Tax=Algoriphagus aquaeductus TaxID=475299 RepID=UPI0038790E7E